MASHTPVASVEMAGDAVLRPDLTQQRHADSATFALPLRTAPVKAAHLGRRVDRAAHLARQADALDPLATTADTRNRRQQCPRIRVTRVGKQGLDRPGFDDPPEIHHHHTVA